MLWDLILEEAQYVRGTSRSFRQDEEVEDENEQVFGKKRQPFRLAHEFHFCGCQ